jgi:hypothetical protein
MKYQTGLDIFVSFGVEINCERVLNLTIRPENLLSNKTAKHKPLFWYKINIIKLHQSYPVRKNMSAGNRNDFAAFLFLGLVGMLFFLNRKQNQQKKGTFAMQNPDAYIPRERQRARTILRMVPHEFGGTIISLN